MGKLLAALALLIVLAGCQERYAATTLDKDQVAGECLLHVRVFGLVPASGATYCAEIRDISGDLLMPNGSDPYRCPNVAGWKIVPSDRAADVFGFISRVPCESIGRTDAVFRL